MIKRVFWLIFGAMLAVLGLSYLKKRAAQNPQHFSADALVERFIVIFDSIKESLQGLWRGYSRGQALNDGELEKIFINQTNLKSEFDSTIKPSDISLN